MLAALCVSDACTVSLGLDITRISYMVFVENDTTSTKFSLD